MKLQEQTADAKKEELINFNKTMRATTIDGKESIVYDMGVLSSKIKKANWIYDFGPHSLVMDILFEDGGVIPYNVFLPYGFKPESSFDFEVQITDKEFILQYIGKLATSDESKEQMDQFLNMLIQQIGKKGLDPQ